MLSIEILDYNGQFHLSYTFESEITRPVEEYAGMSDNPICRLGAPPTTLN